MVLGMVADGVASGQDRRHQLGMRLGLGADQEEGRRHAMAGQDFEHLGGEVRIGAVIDGHGDRLPLPPAMGGDRQKITEAGQQRGQQTTQDEQDQRHGGQDRIETQQQGEQLEGRETGEVGRGQGTDHAWTQVKISEVLIPPKAKLLVMKVAQSVGRTWSRT